MTDYSCASGAGMEPAGVRPDRRLADV